MESKIKYEGYKGIALDKFDINLLSGLRTFLIKNNLNLLDFEKSLGLLDVLPLDEIKALSIKMYEKYFNLHDVYTASESILLSHTNDISNSSSAYEFYEKVNSLLVTKSPFDVDIELVDSHSMYGKVEKPLIITTANIEEKNRKMYFSKIKLGSITNLISVGTYVHEIAHIEQESNIGYTDDYLNKELVSIFLEKIILSELDESGYLLKLCEQIRFSNMILEYSKLFKNPNLQYDKKIEKLAYIKSTLFATKLFDLYQHEGKQKNKDKYIDDVNDIFDGKQKVEDLIIKRNINVRQCQDQQLILRHL